MGQHREDMIERATELRLELMALMKEECLGTQDVARQTDLALGTIYRFVRQERMGEPATLRKIKKFIEDTKRN